MSGFQPLSFAALIERIFQELDGQNSIFGLASKFFFLGSQNDLSVRFHEQKAASPIGPAAGPHTQLAQNIVLAWLGGSRIFELKTVQILDKIELSRPCIDMETVGFNIEWSQELSLEQSLREYVKASMLIEILVASKKLPLNDDFKDVIFDMSVGYDLAGIREQRVGAFIEGMKEASYIIEELRSEIPETFSQYRSLSFKKKIATSLTLSTFHGCPPEEIEQIAEYLFHEHKLNIVIKLNPTLLGKAKLYELLHNVMGYHKLKVPNKAFEKDANWDQVIGFLDRLEKTAKKLKLSFGVKFTNTLLVKNHKDVFSEPEMYLSGAPLHVLAIHLVAKLRAHFQNRFFVSFSAGLDRTNIADAFALGLTPITVCSDLLQTGGYRRQIKYYKQLQKRMNAVSANNFDDFILKAYEFAPSALEKLDITSAQKQIFLAALQQNNTKTILAEHKDLYQLWINLALATKNLRYTKAKQGSPPKKTTTKLTLFDCITCDKCLPVCPNNANFAFGKPTTLQDTFIAIKNQDHWTFQTQKTFQITKKHQIGNFADFCNECGNCETFCPEIGGPYKIKPTFFGSKEAWKKSDRDGFYCSKVAENNTAKNNTAKNGSIYARNQKGLYQVTFLEHIVQYKGPNFSVTFHENNIKDTLSGDVLDGGALDHVDILDHVDVLDHVDLEYYAVLRYLLYAVSEEINYQKY